MAAHQAFGGVHGDGAHGLFAQMLGNFEDQALTIIAGFKRIKNAWQIAFKFDIDDGADHLGNFAFNMDGHNGLLGHLLV